MFELEAGDELIYENGEDQIIMYVVKVIGDKVHVVFDGGGGEWERFGNYDERQSNG